MMEATRTLETPTGAELLMNLGIVKRLQGDLSSAASAYREARRIHSATNLAVPDSDPSCDMASSMETCDGFVPKHLAAGSPLNAARQAHRLEAKLDSLRGS